MENEEDDRWTADPELKAVLIEAMARCDRGEKISAEVLLRELLLDDERPASIEVDEEK